MYQAQILLKQGLSRTAVAQALNVSRKTIYNYEHALVFDRARRGRPGGKSKLAQFHAYIESRLDEDMWINAEILLQQLRGQGYTGQISILRDFLHRKRNEMTNYAVLRFETVPGQQAQVDWAEVGSCIVAGRARKVYAFVMKLGYSRRTYVEFTMSMEQPVLFGCMVHAFEHFGGVPRELLFDNMKTAFLFDMESSRWIVHPKLLSFAQHHGFMPKRCRVRRPKTKGKVEREIRYLRCSFLPLQRDAISRGDLVHLNDAVRSWRARVDSKMLRELGQSRQERFGADSKALQALPAISYDYRGTVPLVVGRDAMVMYQTNRYSVPPSVRGSTVEGRVDPFRNTLNIYQGSKEVRTHQLQPSGTRGTIMNLEDRRDLLKVWEHGRDQEQRRNEARRKKHQAQADNVIAHPRVYDEAFEVQIQGVAV